MARNCGCSGSSCSCSIVAQESGTQPDAITITGIGSAADPFVIGLGSFTIANNVQFDDTPSVEWSVLGEGTPGDPLIISAEATPVAEYQSYIPEVTAASGTPALGDQGAAEGRYVVIGDHVHVQASVLFSGTGVDGGTGYLMISLPVTAAVSPFFARSFGGIAIVRASGAGLIPITHSVISAGSNDVVRLYSYDGTAFGEPESITQIDLNISYEAASA